MAANKKVVVVMPAYNAAKTVEMTYRDIPKDLVSEIILVDDRSTDETLKVARELDIKIIEHPHNVGYGGNQKTCYMEAFRDGADIIIMIHPDNQYNPKMAPEIIKPILEGKADIVLGSRMLQKSGALKGGMPLYKFIANRFLTTLENIVLRTRLTDMHTGYRAYTVDFIKTVPFMRNSNDFVFDSQILAQAAYGKFTLTEVPVETRYFPEASQINFRRSLKYGILTLWVLIRFVLHKLRLWHCPFLDFQRKENAKKDRF